MITIRKCFKRMVILFFFNNFFLCFIIFVLVKHTCIQCLNGDRNYTNLEEDFSGSPVVTILSFLRKWQRFNPWSGN